MNKWLKSKHASPAEIAIYLVIVRLYKIKKFPLQNGEIRQEYGSNRQNIHAHITNMIDKGILVRSGGRRYIPVRVK